MLMDRFIKTFDTALRTVFAEAKATRAHPDAAIEDDEITSNEKRKVIGLMRVNHVGEVCAQALYSGQALTSRNPEVVAALEHAAKEETDHLAWCESRINALGGRKSFLNPLWYMGSFTIGAIAGAIGDKWNLGFLAETEQQVSAHLASHLAQLPNHDKKTRAIIEQMHIDEISHAQEAVNLGAAELPASIKKVMRTSSKVMTTTAYYV
ncbi:MAG: 2-polyprenyl-3-methyl-6-methoxy-1,4-benzoquinone monooxygenase [Methylophilaceae bacterium]|nr:MAG: 2-polyprenyl-3-methyl-6-methoxy-1,4-benzoquinone monooxygenase [Methylophilaceae bacterium]